jgi:hypothetical protein
MAAAPVTTPSAGKHLAGHAEQGGTVGREQAHFVKAVGVHQGGDAFACGQLAGLAVLVQLVGATALLCSAAAAVQVGDLGFHAHGGVLTEA